MTRAHCTRCGSFVSPAPEQRRLFETRGGLPVPANDNAFFAGVRSLQDREAQARKRGDCREIGATRKALRSFVNQALAGGR